MLAKAINIYFASSRKNDFSGSHNYYDIWVFDEFHEPEEKSGLFASTETGSTYSNTLLKMLDGQECRLDSKYSLVGRSLHYIQSLLSIIFIHKKHSIPKIPTHKLRQ
jgi:hypothetical protein